MTYTIIRGSLEGDLLPTVAGDCIYWHANLEQMWPPGYMQGNAWNTIKTYTEIRESVNGEIGRVIPTHEPKLFERHKSWISGRNHVAEVHLAKNEKTRAP